jgi:hypothetical protein
LRIQTDTDFERNMIVYLELFCLLMLLMVPVYFSWEKLLKKRTRSEKTNKITVWLVTVITDPFVFAGIFTAILYAISYYPNHDFDREKWYGSRNKRYEYSRNIIESKMLAGKTKTEIRQLSGDEKANKETGDEWYYDLGMRPGFLIMDIDNLIIEFEDEKVTEVIQAGG